MSQPVVAQGKAPVAIALDAPDLATLSTWASAAAPYISVVKVGLEVFCRDGAAAVQAARAAAPEAGLFLDVKLHDIPATVGGAAAALAHLEPAVLTVHAAGGAAMIAAAAAALPNTAIAAVTVLTSLGESDLEQIGLRGPASDAVRRLAALAVGAGAKALVCSPMEVALVRAEVGPGVLLITPGVRPTGADAGDQVRVATAEQALADGADLLVIGRPITAAADPGAAARAIAESLGY